MRQNPSAAESTVPHPIPVSTLHQAQRPDPVDRPAPDDFRAAERDRLTALPDETPGGHLAMPGRPGERADRLVVYQRRNRPATGNGTTM
jgi:hypothetical protein